jgi:phosphonate transport system substrate-binding protein
MAHRMGTSINTCIARHLASKILVWLACLGVAQVVQAADAAPIRFGVFPNLSVRVLLETYQPIADAVSRSSGQPVELHSAADFRTFHQRTRLNEYDLVLTPPHLAWLAWKEAGYRPLLAYDQPVRGVIVVRRNHDINGLADLKGKTIAKADPLAIAVLRMEKVLGDMGLLAGRDYTVMEAGSHNNAALQVHQGNADAAMLGNLAFQKLPADVKQQLWVIAESAPLPSLVYLVNQRVSPERERQIQGGIERFMQSKAGRAFLDKGGFGGTHRLTRTELNRVAADAQQVKRILGANPLNPLGKESAGVAP